MCKYHWNEAKLFKFLRLYKSHECLWNPYSSLYKNDDAKSEALAKMLSEMRTFGLTINECLSQIKHLNETYKREEKKLRNIELLGGRGYSNLLWYPLMNSMFTKVVKDAKKLREGADGDLSDRNKNQRNFMNDGDHFADRNHLSNDHISSCPTCGYSMNTCKSQGDDPRSKIVSYNRAKASYSYKKRMLETNSVVNNNVDPLIKDDKKSAIMKQTKNITRHNLVKIVLDFVGKILNDSDVTGRNEGERLILKKMVKDLRAVVENHWLKDNKKMVKAVDKMICWREPVEEICHITSPCKSTGSASKIEGSILRTRQRSPCFRMLAGSDSGIDETMNQFDPSSCDRKNDRSLGNEEKYIGNAETSAKNSEQMIQSSVYKADRKDEGITDRYKNEESQTNNLIENDEKCSKQFGITETTTAELNHVTMRNVIVEMMAENLEYRKDGGIEEEVVDKITGILRENLHKNDGQAIMKRNYKFVTKKNVRLMENEAMWKIELKNIVADLIKRKKNGNSITFKVKTTILPAVEFNQANSEFLIEDEVKRSDENCGNIPTKSSDYELKEESNRAIETRDELLFDLKKTEENQNNRKYFSEWESLSDNSNDEERTKLAPIIRRRRRNLSSLYIRQNWKGIRDKRNVFKKHSWLQDSRKLIQIRNNDEYSIDDHCILDETHSVLNTESMKGLLSNGEMISKVDKMSETIKIFLASDKRRQFIISNLQKKLSTNNSKLIGIFNERSNPSGNKVIDRNANDKCLQTSVSDGFSNGITNKAIGNLCRPIFVLTGRLRLCEIVKTLNEITRSETNAPSIDAYEKIYLKNIVMGDANVESESKSCQTESCWRKSKSDKIMNHAASDLEKLDVQNIVGVDINDELGKSYDQPKEKREENNENVENVKTGDNKISQSNGARNRKSMDNFNVVEESGGIDIKTNCQAIIDRVQEEVYRDKKKPENFDGSGESDESKKSQIAESRHPIDRNISSKNYHDAKIPTCNDFDKELSTTDLRIRNIENDNSNYYICCRESTEVDMDKFVATVASQLRRLSKEAALRSQQRIQTLISNSRLESEKIKKRR